MNTRVLAALVVVCLVAALVLPLGTAAQGPAAARAAKRRAAAAAGDSALNPAVAPLTRAVAAFDRSWLKPPRVGSKPGETLPAFHPKVLPKPSPEIQTLNWQAPRRSYALRELAHELVNDETNTRVVPKVGKKPAGPTMPAARTLPFIGGKILGGRGAKPIFSPRIAKTQGMGRGRDLNPVKHQAVGPRVRSARGKLPRVQAQAPRVQARPPRVQARAPRPPAPTPWRDVPRGAFVETAAAAELETKVGGYSDLKLPSGLVITGAQLDAIDAAFTKQPTPRVFYHWGDVKSSIRWGRQRNVDAGEIKWLNQQVAGMAAGGGYYLAGDPKSSYAYGPVCCYITTPAGTPILDVPQTPIVKVLKKALSSIDKTALGEVIPFVHLYDTSRQWFVTHHPKVLSNIRCGNALITPDPLGPKPIPNPTVNVDTYTDLRKQGTPAGSGFIQTHFDGYNNQVVTFPTIRSQYDAHMYVMNLTTGAWPDNQALGKEVQDAASWVSSFFVLMSYIDGLSLSRAKQVLPSDPWQAFEPAKFGNFRATFDKYILKKSKGEKWGITTGSVFGDGGKDATKWATQMVDVLLPQLYNELSGGGQLKYRTNTVRGGGPIKQDPANKWTTGYFVATTGQVLTMQQNQYLSVESQAYPEGGDANLKLTAYYYPDPMRIGGMINKLSPTLKAAIVAAKNYTGADGKALLERDTPLLMRELLLDMFRGLYGKAACSGQIDFSGALQAALLLVSIHPCSDFNGRTTRFFMYLAALEGCGQIPVSFMSDFDIVTQFSKYFRFMQAGNEGYLQLKVAMLSELISSLANNRIARQYDLPEWGIFLSKALSVFGTPKAAFTGTLSDVEIDMIKTRQFVPIIDMWFGKAWPGRNAV